MDHLEKSRSRTIRNGTSGLPLCLPEDSFGTVRCKSLRTIGCLLAVRLEVSLDPLVAGGLKLVDMTIISIYPDIQTTDIAARSPRRTTGSQPAC